MLSGSNLVIDFTLLGPLSVRVDGDDLKISAPQQRVVLATLLLNPNRVVSIDRVARFLWGNTLPPSATATVRTYVMRLRRTLGEQAGARILTRAPGYLAGLSDHETDLGRFTLHRAVARTKVADGELQAASTELGEALKLWRQSPLQDVPSQVLRDVELNRLHELHMQTLEWRIDLDLTLGRHAELVPELWTLIREHPLRESLVAKMMLTLYRAGQQPDAFELFHHTRDMLIDRLGVEPGAELRRMHLLILGDNEAQRHHRESETIGAHQPKPAQLPPALPDFTARKKQVVQLRAMLSVAGSAATAVTATVVTGGGGVGKSALAVHVAHLIRDQFPDGQLYACLSGAHGRALQPFEVLLRFLRDLSVPECATPEREIEVVALYRSLVADRRMLVLLDDAQEVAQVQPLIPSGGGSRVIITSRHRLVELAGIRILELSRMDEQESIELLGRIVGKHRAATEPIAARQIAMVCAGLPLAIRIAGARSLGRPHWDLSELALRLTTSQRLLDELRIGDLAVRTSLEVSFAALSRQQGWHSSAATALRALGIVGAVSASPMTLSAMLGCSPEQAEELLELLVDAHLLDPHGSGRYHLHSLLRIFIRECAEREESAEQRNTTLTRLLTWYLRVAKDAHHALTLPSPLSRTVPAGGAVPGVRFASRQEAMAWLEAERENLVSALTRAQEIGQEDQEIGQEDQAIGQEELGGQLMIVLSDILYACGRDSAGLDLLHRTLSWAKRTGNREREDITRHKIETARLATGRDTKERAWQLRSTRRRT